MTGFTTAAEREQAIRDLDPAKHKAVVAHRIDQGPETAQEYRLWEGDTRDLHVGLGGMIRRHDGTVAADWSTHGYLVLVSVVPHPLPPLPTAFGSLITATPELENSARSKMTRHRSYWVDKEGTAWPAESLSDWVIHFDAGTVQS